MTDNEKRAHDLTIAMIPIIYDKNYRGKEIVGGNAFDIYHDLYQQFIEQFNQEYR